MYNFLYFIISYDGFNYIIDSIVIYTFLSVAACEMNLLLLIYLQLNRIEGGEYFHVAVTPSDSPDLLRTECSEACYYAITTITESEQQNQNSTNTNSVVLIHRAYKKLSGETCTTSSARLVQKQLRTKTRDLRLEAKTAET